MIIIGVDPHKSVHVASAVDPATNRRIDTIKAEASLAGYRRLLRWADKLGERRWAIENARGLGRHLAQWLVARDEVVDDVPSTATARVRELSRGVRRKNDVIYAAAAASVAALQGDANQVKPEDLTTVLALLDERRMNVVVQRTRPVNQLQALLRDLVPGGGPKDLTCHHRIEAAEQGATGRASRDRLARTWPGTWWWRSGRPISASGRARLRYLKPCPRRGTRLLEVDGVGPVVAAKPAGSQPPSVPVRHGRRVRQLLRSCTHRGVPAQTEPGTGFPAAAIGS